LEDGVKVRIMGGTCLDLPPQIDVLPENAEPAEDFLRSLDIFFFRTHPAWTEAYGRVVFEAMACGLPVVGETRHGYSAKLKHGENALLVESDEAAYQAILGLRDREKRNPMSQMARQTVEAIYGPGYRTAMQEFYGK
jgi:glycosyltransferase involved in cell wall biosynthesis